MATLLLRLAAPLQCWGVDSKFETRKTNREPTKSGVLGLVAAALGLRRDDEEGLARLASLRFGVRVDREGDLLNDFHTAKNPLPAEIKECRKNRKKPPAPYVTHRYYLCDAVFLVGLESDDRAWLGALEAALRRPVYPPFLGRRSCPPTQPLCLGVREAELVAALRAEPRLVKPRRGEGDTLRLVIDAAPGEAGAPVRDLPLSFSPFQRRFGFRPAREAFVPAPREPEAETAHDPFVEL